MLSNLKCPQPRPVWNIFKVLLYNKNCKQNLPNESCNSEKMTKLRILIKVPTFENRAFLKVVATFLNSRLSYAEVEEVHAQEKNINILIID